MVPAVLEALGLETPAVGGVIQSPFEGASLVSCLADTGALKRQVTHHFDMHGRRSLDHDVQGP